MKRFDCSAGEVLEAVWEQSKAELHTHADYDGKLLPTPAARKPPIVIYGRSKRDVIEVAKAGEKVEVRVALRPEVAQEVVALARHLDRPLSWILWQAFLLARPRVVD